MTSQTDLLALYRSVAVVSRFNGNGREPTDATGAAAVLCGALSALRKTDHVIAKIDHELLKLASAANETPRIVTGGMRHALEPAYTAQGRDEQSIVCCLFDDSSLGDGEFHEAINEAAVAALPIVFVCENNFYGLGTLFDGASCQEDLYRFVSGYKIPAWRVDGLDALEVRAAVFAASNQSRAGEGPGLIDAVTYHPRGDARETAAFKSPREEIILRDRNPVETLRSQIVAAHPDAEAALDEIDRECGFARQRP